MAHVTPTRPLMAYTRQGAFRDRGYTRQGALRDRGYTRQGAFKFGVTSALARCFYCNRFFFYFVLLNLVIKETAGNAPGRM